MIFLGLLGIIYDLIEKGNIFLNLKAIYSGITSFDRMAKKEK